MFRKMDYHVITFDYRGYADSTPAPPHETGVVSDAMTVYNWLKQRIGNILVLSNSSFFQYCDINKIGSALEEH